MDEIEIVREGGMLHTSVRLARAYLQAHYADKVELDELARAARIGKYHLVHLFSAQLGCSPFRYLAELRLAHARTLLARGVACAEVAHEVGFCDQSHLNRWFKRRFGISPGAYARDRPARSCVMVAHGG